MALQLLCESYADWTRLREEVAEQGETYETTTASGDRMKRPNPKVALRDNAEKLLRASLVDFGLNPSARARLNIVDVPTQENRFAKMQREYREAEAEQTRGLLN